MIRLTWWIKALNASLMSGEMESASNSEQSEPKKIRHGRRVSFRYKLSLRKSNNNFTLLLYIYGLYMIFVLVLLSHWLVCDLSLVRIVALEKQSFVSLWTIKLASYAQLVQLDFSENMTNWMIASELVCLFVCFCCISPLNLIAHSHNETTYYSDADVPRCEQCLVLPVSATVRNGDKVHELCRSCTFAMQTRGVDHTALCEKCNRWIF